MSLIVTTDIHLTDNPDHAYRWKIFEFLKKRAREHQRNGDVPKLIIAGDMTEAKEGHSAHLVNEFAQEIAKVGDYFAHVYLQRGNHDYKPGARSFFSFLRFMPRVTWADDVYWATDRHRGTDVNAFAFLLAPHGVDFTHLRRKCAIEKPAFVFLHEGFEGAKAANGYALEGHSLSELRGIKARIFSGDIHTRQRVKRGSIVVDYIGTPYPIDFDEDHACRVIEISAAGKVTSVPTNIVRKHTLTVNSSSDLRRQLVETNAGDQVKVRWLMSTADLSRASELYTHIVGACSEARVLLTGGVEYLFDQKTGPHALKIEAGNEPDAQNTVHQIFNAFVKVRKLRKPLVKAGRRVMKRGGAK